MKEMINLYLEQTPPLIKAMNQSVQNRDWPMLQSSVHKMIPSFSIMGISTEFENMAKQIQEYAHKQQETDDLVFLTTKLEAVLNQSLIELQEELKLLVDKKIV